MHNTVVINSGLQDCTHTFAPKNYYNESTYYSGKQSIYAQRINVASTLGDLDFLWTDVSLNLSYSLYSVQWLVHKRWNKLNFLYRQPI